jgi:hypothetical protein
VVDNAELKAKAKPGLDERIGAYLSTRKSEYTNIGELGTQLSVPLKVVNLALGRMVKAGKIERDDLGRV